MRKKLNKEQYKKLMQILPKINMHIMGLEAQREDDLLMGEDTAELDKEIQEAKQAYDNGIKAIEEYEENKRRHR